MPITPVLRMLRLEDCCGFEGCLGCIMSLKPHSDIVSKNKRSRPGEMA